MALALGLLLIGPAGRFLALAAREVAPILALAFILRGARLLERDGDRLPRVLHLARLATWSALEFAMGVFVHHATHGLALGHRCLCHSDSSGCAPLPANGQTSIRLH